MQVCPGATLALLAVLQAATEYVTAIEQWRKEREASLRSEEGWLAVCGLFWLEEGENAVGSAPGSRVLLPADAAPARVGVIRLQGERAVFAAEPGVPALWNGKPVHSAELRPDSSGAQDVLQVGRLKLVLLRRGERYAIRLRDPECQLRKNFRGLKWFPVREQWRIAARFLPAPADRKLVVDTIIGTQEEMPLAGEVEFERDGRIFRLLAARSGQRLFIVFRDATAGKSTYAAARFLYADPPQDGRVILDFNRAINPPCAYNPYTTCPLPPLQNRLPVEIPAGEMAYENGPPPAAGP
ncbi:MAG: DUF1684 domain-containing protein [Bryobacterales bacterium]|nr:DUF1684 domain-containing protein [Bryobacteraceae bacterium]MDW8130996.1 DUF1684 domain-containing protein [Bryobacterales bacterium]